MRERAWALVCALVALAIIIGIEHPFHNSLTATRKEILSLEPTKTTVTFIGKEGFAGPINRDKIDKKRERKVSLGRLRRMIAEAPAHIHFAIDEKLDEERATAYLRTGSAFYTTDIEDDKPSLYENNGPHYKQYDPKSGEMTYHWKKANAPSGWVLSLPWRITSCILFGLLMAVAISYSFSRDTLWIFGLSDKRFRCN